MMRQWTIDAFTSRAFGGNPACIVEPLRQWPEASWMQALARENAAGATAFLVSGESAGQLAMRWFTPWVEVPLCGHATLAAAHALFREAGFAGDMLRFDTRSGPLVVARDGSGYEMRFPAQSATQIPVHPALTEALGQRPIEAWAGPYLVAVFDTPDAVHALKPDSEKLLAVSLAYGGQGNVGIAALAPEAASYDVIDRFFAPGYGIKEDAATGSFHCVLTPIFAPRVREERIRFHQACPGRGAELSCRLEGDRVLLTGEAVTIAESALRVRP
jgi:PhzF family phenazine biosynthesis protein